MLTSRQSQDYARVEDVLGRDVDAVELLKSTRLPAGPTPRGLPTDAEGIAAEAPSQSHARGRQPEAGIVATNGCCAVPSGPRRWETSCERQFSARWLPGEPKQHDAWNRSPRPRTTWRYLSADCNVH